MDDSGNDSNDNDSSYDFDFDGLDSFIPGAIGEPGRRVFYIQARRGDQVVALRLEKEQVGMLGGYLGNLVTALGSPDPDRDIAGLIEPVNDVWTVGSISVGLDDSQGLIHVTAEELLLDDQTEVEPHEEPASARFVIRADQAAAFAEAALELVMAGRPPCRLCGAPMDPSGHACPRWN